CSKEDVPLPAEGIFGLLPTFVTPAQIVQFSNDNGKLQDVLISVLGESWDIKKKGQGVRQEGFAVDCVRGNQQAGLGRCVRKQEQKQRVTGAWQDAHSFDVLSTSSLRPQG
ncbi:unnamed protein product, partial [Pylaiella littoralis]